MTSPEIFDGPVNDPYKNCEEKCNHDLVRGVLVADLLGTDGPFHYKGPLFIPGQFDPSAAT